MVEGSEDTSRGHSPEWVGLDPRHLRTPVCGEADVQNIPAPCSAEENDVEDPKRCLALVERAKSQSIKVQQRRGDTVQNGAAFCAWWWDVQAASTAGRRKVGSPHRGSETRLHPQ